MPRLVVITETGDIQRQHPLSNSNSLGRHPSQTIQLLDQLVSKEHATVTLRNGEFVLEDLASRNGTFINEVPVTAPVVLSNGDKVVMGSTTMRYESDDSQAQSNRPVTVVTMATELVQSAIAARIEHTKNTDFVPESAINNENELRSQYERLRLAYTLQREIALEVEETTLLEKILQNLFSTLNCERGVILLPDPVTGELAPRCIHTRNANDSQDIELSSTIIQQVVTEKTGVLSSDAQLDDRFNQAQSIMMHGIRSAMCVPMIAHDEVLGVIHIDSRIASSAFTERDLHIVQGLAHQAALALENATLVQQHATDAALREKFKRLLSPNLVEQMVKGDLEIEQGGQSRFSTVLFSDLRGFTAMSERKQPEEIVAMLNEYFEYMTNIVFEYDGTLDKYMGDGIMAVFGSPVDIPEAAIKAAAAALKMQSTLADFNATRMQEGLEPMYMGIGIDAGDLIAGYMGSKTTMSYTVMGPAVNLASRLCGIAKPTEVLVSARTLTLLGGQFDYSILDPVKLKGIAQPVTPYNLTSIKQKTQGGL